VPVDARVSADSVSADCPLADTDPLEKGAGPCPSASASSNGEVLAIVKLASFEAIVRALNAAGARHIVVGGLAVNAHGYLRYTNDVDLVIQLTRDVILAAFRALETIDYHPAVPISAEQFADPLLREQWRREKGMQVLKFWSDIHRETPLDIFIYEPFDFAAEEVAALRSDEPDTPKAAFASIPSLIAMKQVAARPLDLVDIEKLEKLAEIRRNESEA
jgi:hypothetical protein